jgi:hypothetical protein
MRRALAAALLAAHVAPMSPPRMNAIRTPLDGEQPRAGQLSGVVCPDCPGSLWVREEGHKGYLVFECRIGHLYSLEQLIALKEQRFEEHLWAAVSAGEELSALLGDLGLAGDRRRALDGHGRALRAMLEDDQPAEVGTIGRLDGEGRR